MRRPGAPPFRDTEWRLHLGAHKTATTHLQTTLDLIRPRLAASGVGAVPVATFRPLWGDLVRRNYRVTRLLERGLAVPPRGTRALAEAMAPFRAGGAAVLISDENVVGHARAGLAPVPYANLAVRVGLLRALLGRRAPARIFFAIRDMGTFLPSIHAEALRFFALGGPFETVAAAALATPPRWTEVVDRLRTAWPEARLSVWRYEDYRAHGAALLAHVAGVDPGPLPTVPRPRSTMTPSAEAVRRVERAAGDLEGLDMDARARRVAEIYAAAPAEEPGTAFRPLTPDQVARCRAAYEADCAALARDGVLWTP